MKKSFFLVFFALLLSSSSFAQEGMLGEIRMFAGNFAPRGWAFCDGRSMNISENAALYSLLGTNYGGNGTSTFNLPDLRGKVPVGINPTSSTPISQGSTGGNSTITLTPVNTSPSATGQVVQVLPGSGTVLNNRQPSLGVNFIICVEGLYPSRD